MVNQGYYTPNLQGRWGQYVSVGANVVHMPAEPISLLHYMIANVLICWSGNNQNLILGEKLISAFIILYVLL